MLTQHKQTLCPHTRMHSRHHTREFVFRSTPTHSLSLALHISPSCTSAFLCVCVLVYVSWCMHVFAYTWAEQAVEIPPYRCPRLPCRCMCVCVYLCVCLHAHARVRAYMYECAQVCTTVCAKRVNVVYVCQCVKQTLTNMQRVCMRRRHGRECLMTCPRLLPRSKQLLPTRTKWRRRRRLPAVVPGLCLCLVHFLKRTRARACALPSAPNPTARLNVYANICMSMCLYIHIQTSICIYKYT